MCVSLNPLLINNLFNFAKPPDLFVTPLKPSVALFKYLNADKNDLPKVYGPLEKLLKGVLEEVQALGKERCNYLENQIALQEQNTGLTTRVHNLEKELYSIRSQISNAVAHLDEILADLEKFIVDKDSLKMALTIIKDLLTSAIKEPAKPSRYRYNIEVIKMTILLVVHAGCSLRSAVAALGVFKKYIPYMFKNRVPAYTTARDWVMKGGLVLAPYLTKRIKGKYCFIVDESIALNGQKMLVILAVPVSPYGIGPLSFKDVSIVIMKTQEKWEHQDIMRELRAAKKELGRMPEYVLSDGGTNINKAVDLLHWNKHRDIGHTLANVLKHAYVKDERFQEFLKDLGSLKNLTLSVSAPFAPPKQRSKVRFMNIAPSVRWALWIIEGYHLLDPLSQKRFKKICTKHAGIVTELKEVIDVCDKILKMAKERGLSYETVKKSLDLLMGLPRYFPGTLKVQDEFSKYLKEEEKLLKDEKDCHVISSDIIESFFSVVKRRLPNAKYYGYTEYCLSMFARLFIDTPEDFDGIDIFKGIEGITLKEVKKWRIENTVESAYKKRMEHKKKMEQAKASKSA